MELQLLKFVLLRYQLGIQITHPLENHLSSCTHGEFLDPNQE